MRGAADTLSVAAYDGTDAVVTAPRPRSTSTDDDWTLTPARRSTPTLLDRVRARAAASASPSATSPTRRKIVGTRRQARRRRPVLRRRLRRRPPGADAAHARSASTPAAGPTGPGEVVIDAGTADKQDYARRRHASRIATARRGAALHASPASRRFGAVKSLGTATVAVFDLRDRAGAVRQGRALRLDPRRRRATASPAPTCARRCPPALGRRPQVQTAADAGPLHARRAEAVRHDHPARPAGLRRRRACSSARSRSSTRSRSPSPSARASSGCCGWSAPRAARCSRSVVVEALAIGAAGLAWSGSPPASGWPRASTRCSRRSGLDLPQTGHGVRHAHDRRVAARRHRS